MNIKSEKKHNYFYKVTNLLDGKFYYGIHSTNKLDDRYFAGGSLIKRAINKYGKENFQKEILIDFPTRSELSDYERSIVTIDLINDSMCYNLVVGGDQFLPGGYSDERNKKVSESKKGNQHFLGKHHNDETKSYMSILMSEKYSDGKHPMIGVKRSEEYCNKMSEIQKNIAKYGEDNPNFGSTRTDETCDNISKGNLGKPKHGPDSKLKMSLAKKDKPGHKYTRGHHCKIYDVEYNSISAACRELNLGIERVRRRINSNDEKWKDWIFIEKDSDNV